MIRLGDVVRDKFSGFEGVAVAKHSYVNGCDRYTVQPKVNSDMKLPDSETFDAQQLIVVEERLESFNRNTGGPSKYEDKRKY